MPGRPAYLNYSRARAHYTCSRCGWGLFGHFFSRLSHLFFSPSLWETARYRLKYCLKGPLDPKQPCRALIQTALVLVGWLVGCFGFNGPLRQYFSLYRAVSQREGERGEKGQMREKMSKQPPPAPIASATGPCPTIIQISRTPRH